MQSNLSAGSTLYQCPLPWRCRGINFTAQKAIFTTPKFPSRKTLTLTKSLRTSINYNNEEEVNNRPGPANPVRLPVVIRKSGRVSRYLWNGYCLELIRTDGGASSFCFEFDNGFQKLFRVSSLAVRDFFIPKRVDENYMGYVQWKFLHRVFSSALQVLATQAMFRAIGIGYSRSLPSAAALNWVLKDGLGRLSRCIYTASLSSAFDTNLKRVRFTTSVVFSLSIGVELLTPVFPDYFLLLASIANIAKQISLACYLATASAVHRSFAIVDNLGEVSAKAQIQSVCFDNIGLMLAAILNMFVKNHQRLQAGLPFIIYPFFSAIDLFGIYQGLKHVHLQTLTKDRLEIILDTWIKFRHVPSPAEVSKEEGINFLGKKCKKSWPIRIGCLDPKGEMSNLSMMAMKSLSSDDYYFICMEIYRGLRRIPQQGILISLREGAGTADIIMGLLQACYVRAALCLRSRWENMITTNAMSDLILEEWFSLMEESKLLAESDYFLLDKQMSEQGWAVKNILLNSQEQARYSFVDD